MQPPALWGFLGLFAGGWKLAILAGALFALFGARFRPAALRWLSPTNQRMNRGSIAPKADSDSSRFGDRVYWMLVIIASTAVATWIIAHFTISRSVH